MDTEKGDGSTHLLGGGKPVVQAGETDAQKKGRFGTMLVFDIVMIVLLIAYGIALSVRDMSTAVRGVVSACVFLVVYVVIMVCQYVLGGEDGGSYRHMGKWIALLLRLVLAGGIVGACFFPGLDFETTYIFAGIFIFNLLLGAIATLGLCRCRCDADKKA